jgi:hypothetical protein
MRQRDHLIPPLVVVTCGQIGRDLGRISEMREFLVAVVAAIVIAGIAAVALNSAQRDAEIAYHSTTGVRI